MDELKNKWAKAKTAVKPEPLSIEALITKAGKKRRSVLNFHYGNVIILTLVLIGISLFFYYVAPLREFLSHIGIALMTGGLALRIIIELWSTVKSQKIEMINEASTTTNDTLEYYNFRKRIHGPVTLIIVVLYSIGFYLLTPEFSLYIAFEWMVMIHLSYVVGAIFLIWQIRKGIRKEMVNLEDLVELKREMENG